MDLLNYGAAAQTQNQGKDRDDCDSAFAASYAHKPPSLKPVVFGIISEKYTADGIADKSRKLPHSYRFDRLARNLSMNKDSVAGHDKEQCS
jgi:hypothetical protein